MWKGGIEEGRGRDRGLDERDRGVEGVEVSM